MGSWERQGSAGGAGRETGLSRSRRSVRHGASAAQGLGQCPLPMQGPSLGASTVDSGATEALHPTPVPIAQDGCHLGAGH